MAKIEVTAQNAIANIQQLIKEVENLKTSLKSINESNRDTFTKLEEGLAKVKSQTENLSHKMRYLEGIVKKQTEATESNTKASKKSTQAKKQETKQVEKTLSAYEELVAQQKLAKDAYLSAIVEGEKNKRKLKELETAYNRLTKQVRSANKELKTGSGGLKKMSLSALSVVKSFGLLAGIRGLYDISKNIYETAKTFDSLNFAMERITKTAWGYSNSTIFLTDLTRSYGVELVSTTNRWIKFLAAAEQSGLSLRDTEKIFRSMTKASAVLGLNTEELTGVYLALEQMLSKGKVTTEELRRQLGERLPGAMGIMAASMGKTIPELDEMLKKGQVLSAEVLPNFAKAVELAYGIENVEKVETLVAAQNRLTASWQNFIKAITQGDSIFKKAIGGMINKLSELFDMIAYVSGGDKFREAIDLIEFEKDWERFFRRMAETAVNDSRAIETHFGALKNRINEYKDQIEEARSAGKTDEASALEELMNADLIILQELDAKIEAKLKETAKNQIESYRDKYRRLEEIRDTVEEEMAKPLGSLASIQYEIDKYRDVVKIQDLLDEAEVKKFEDLRIKILQAKSAYNVLRKLVDENKVEVLPENEAGKKTPRQLRQIKDLSLEIARDIAKAFAQSNADILADDEANVNARIDAANGYYNAMRNVINKNLEIKIRDIEIANKAEDEGLKQSLKNGTLSYEKYYKFLEERKKETDQKIELAQKEHGAEMVSLNDKLQKALDKVKTTSDSFEVKQVELPYQQRIRAIKDEYELSAKTTEDKKRMETELAKVQIDMTNAVIAKKVELLKAIQATFKEEDDFYKHLSALIAELEAGFKVTVPDTDDAIVDWWEFSLEMAQEYASAIGDIVDNLFERRIENINAEIEATKNMYDYLIGLAKDDAVQREILERNKQKAIEKLEKKRLREEQKQAKARKAFAVADIAIKTAQAIMGIWADFPKADFGITAGIMTAVVGALGAAQIAAVLAQPIPKYKEGRRERTRTETAMINDGLVKEYIERGSNILSTDRKNAIVKLQPSDIVYKSYDDMVKKSKLFNTMSGGEYISENDFNKIFMGINNSIKDGFKKAKINNNTTVIVKQKDNSYRDRMSRW